RIAQAREGEAAVGVRVDLGERDERLDHAAQLLRLRQGGADRLVAQQRYPHGAHERVTVRAVTRQLPAGKMVTHKLEPFALSQRFPRGREVRGTLPCG